MTKEQFEQYKQEMKDHISQTIVVTVNGKIDKLNYKLDEYIKQDEVWKKGAQPAIDIGTNIRGFSKVALYTLGFMAAIGAAWIAVERIGTRLVIK